MGLGVNSLKTKPFRLIITIFLSVIAFALFGIFDTVGAYNDAKQSLAGKNNQYFSHTASGTLKWVFWKGFTLTAAVNYNQYIGFTNDYNEDYLNRMFKAHYGEPLKSYIDRERIGFIKKLLLEDALPLAEVAQKAGFQDYKYFLKYFKYHEGITPTEFKLTYSKTLINTF